MCIRDRRLWQVRLLHESVAHEHPVKAGTHIDYLDPALFGDVGHFGGENGDEHIAGVQYLVVLDVV